MAMCEVIYVYFCMVYVCGGMSKCGLMCVIWCVCRVLLNVGGQYNEGTWAGGLVGIFVGGRIYRMAGMMTWQSDENMCQWFSGKIQRCHRWHFEK